MCLKTISVERFVVWVGNSRHLVTKPRLARRRARHSNLKASNDTISILWLMDKAKTHVNWETETWRIFSCNNSSNKQTSFVHREMFLPGRECKSERREKINRCKKAIRSTIAAPISSKWSSFWSCEQEHSVLFVLHMVGPLCSLVVSILFSFLFKSCTALQLQVFYLPSACFQKGQKVQQLLHWEFSRQLAKLQKNNLLSTNISELHAKNFCCVIAPFLLFEWLKFCLHFGFFRIWPRKEFLCEPCLVLHQKVSLSYLPYSPLTANSVNPTPQTQALRTGEFPKSSTTQNMEKNSQGGKEWTAL